MGAVAMAHRIYPDRYEQHVDDLGFYESREYQTHTNAHALRLHWVIERIFLVPFQLCQRGYAHMSMPCPGEGKDLPLWQQRAIRVGAFFLFVAMIPLALVSLILTMALRALSHGSRPLFQWMKKGEGDNKIDLKKELHVRTANLSLTPTSWVNVANDMRHPETRARELVESFRRQDGMNPPSIVVCQEAFNEDAAQIFCEGLSGVYPHIIHSVAPQIGGMGSGYLVLSKYQPIEVHFYRFHDMTWQHSMPPRGILAVHFKMSGGERLIVYDLHTQSLWGQRRAEARENQIEQLRLQVHEDRQKFRGCEQIMMGDFNTASVKENGEDSGEGRLVAKLAHDFVQPQLTNRCLSDDNEKMGVKLEQPTGTFVEGCCPDAEIPGHPYGTSRWFETQAMAAGCLLDRILLHKETNLQGEITIRRIVHGDRDHPAQSPPSDHAFLDGFFKLKDEIELP